MECSVRAYDDLSAVEEWADEWQQLHDEAADPNPFSAPEWPLTWLRHFAGNERTKTLVLAVRTPERLIGVAPLIQRSAARGALRMVSPVGIGTPWVMPFELPTVVAAPGLGRDVCREIVQYLGRESQSWDVARLMFGHAAGWLEPQWIVEHSHAVLVRRLRSNVVLPLDSDTDPFVGRRNLKESFRRARNRLTKDFGADGWSVICHRTPGDVDAMWQRLQTLHRSRAGMAEGVPKHSDALGDASVVAYLGDVLGRMAHRDLVRGYELRIADEVVASQLVLRTPTSSYFSLSGMTAKAWKYSAVTYLQSVAVADAREDGHRVVDLSMGPTQAKMRWSEQVEYYPEFWLVGQGVRSRSAYVAEEIASVFSSLRDARSANPELVTWRDALRSKFGSR